MGKSRLLRELEARLRARDPAPNLRQGRCLPYGSSIVFWALGEVLRAECGIVDADPSDVAWRKLTDRLEELLVETGERVTNETGLRQAALMARLLGHRGARGAVPVRVRRPAAHARGLLLRRALDDRGDRGRRPLVLAFEDIHWADDGMLDLIEHLAQWVRGPLLLLCLARDELLERRRELGRRAPRGHVDLPRPAHADRDARPHRLPAARPTRAGPSSCPRWPSAPAATRSSPRRWCAGWSRRAPSDATALPDTVQALLAARLDSLDPFERRLVQQAAVVGRTFWDDALAPVADAEGRDLDRSR